MGTTFVPHGGSCVSPKIGSSCIIPNGPAVIWEAPPAQGGVTITGYEVSWRDDLNRVWSNAVLVSGGAAARTWAPMIDAVAGRTYEFRLRTVSAAGFGPWSAPAAITAPELLTPSTPLDVEAFVGPDGPAVLWEPPAPVAGAVVSGYDVSWRDDVNRVWSQTVRVSGGAEARTWAPMVAAVPGRMYEFRVRAVSAAGPGPWSEPATIAAPELLTPSTPLDVEAFIGPDGPAVLWEPPAPVAGAAVSGYDVSWRDDVNRVWSQTVRVSGGAEARTWAPMVAAVPGRTYEFRVRALSAAGPGPWSAPATIAAPELLTPSTPLDVEAFIGPDGPAVLWEPPAPVAGAEIIRYDVSWRTDVAPVWTDHSSVIGGPNARTWAPMVAAVPGRTYEFRVRAVSAAGPGPWSTPAAITAPDVPTPSAPLNLRLVSEGADLIATWDEPADIASVPVAEYELRFRGTGINDRWRIIAVPGGTLRAHIPASHGLVEGGTYRAQVRALGTGGAGPWSDEVENLDIEPATVEIIDETPPDYAHNEPFRVKFQFSEPVIDFTSDDITVVPGQILEMTGEDDEYHITINPDGDGILRLQIRRNAFQDAHENWNADQIEASFPIDTILPTVTITTDARTPVAGYFEIKIAFDEPVSNFSKEDIVYVNGNGWTPFFREDTDHLYTAGVRPLTSGRVHLRVPLGAATDRADNPNPPADFSISAYIQDNSGGPQVQFTTTAAAPVTGPFPLEIAFSEPIVGLDLNDLVVGNGSASALQGASSTYMAQISPATTGTVTVDMPKAAVQDVIGNPNQVAPTFSIEAVLLDSAGPRVQITTTATEPVTGPFSIDITFSAAVTGFTVHDLNIRNGTASRFTGGGSAYAATITPTMTGTVTVDIAAGAAQDANNAPSQAAARLSVEAMTPVPALPAAAAAILGLALVLAGRRAHGRRQRHARQSDTNPGPIRNQ